MKEIRFYSTLENGHRVDGRLSIGTTVKTQWGPRKVVSTGDETVDRSPSGETVAEIAQRVE